MRPKLVVAAAALAVASACALVAAIALRAAPTAPPMTRPGLAPDRAAPAALPATGEPAPASRATAPSTQQWVVHGSCVDWDSGATVLHCAISVVPAAAQPSAAGPSTDPAAGQTSTRSDGHGRFTVTLPPASGEVDLRVSSPGRVTIERRLAARGGVSALGEVRLRRGARVGGVLRDQDARPQPDATIELHYGQALHRGDGWVERYATRVRTRTDGSFVFATVLPAGVVDVKTPGTPPLLDRDHVVLEAGRSTHLELICRTIADADRIRGVVRDRNGRGRGQALVQAFTTATVEGTPVVWTHTDDDGHFRLHRLRRADEPVQLTALDLRTGERSVGVTRTAWGEGDVVLELCGDDGVRLQVVDAESGNAIEAYAVQCVRTAGVRSPLSGELRNDGHHDGGWTWLDGLTNGPYELIVRPHDPRWLPNLPQAFEVDERGGNVRVALPRATPCRVRVEDEAGQPLAGMQLELLRPQGGSLTRDLADVFRHGGLRGPLNLRLATATTDAEGRASLRWFADPQPLELRLHGPHAAAHVEHGVQLGTGEVLVRVDNSGQLHLDLAGAAGHRLLLQEVTGSRQLPLFWQEAYELDDHGRLRLPVPAGRWQLRLARRPVHDDRIAPVFVASPTPVATVDIAAGRTTELTLDLRSTLAAGELNGVAFVDGRPGHQVLLQIGATDDDGRLRCVHQLAGSTDAHGRFRFPGLGAGDYALQLRTTCGGKDLLVPITAWQHLSPGQRLDLPAFALTTAPATVELRHADGRPMVDAQLILSADAGFALIARPDEHGRVRFDDLPTARYELLLRQKGASTALGTFDVAVGRRNRHVVEIAR